jgi:hypothetical protein
MFTITALSCIVGLTPVGPLPEPSSQSAPVFVPAASLAGTLQTGRMIDVPDNARIRAPDEPAITVVGGASPAEPAAEVVAVDAFGSPIIARSDLVMRSFDKRVNFTEIRFPGVHHRRRPSAGPTADDLKQAQMRENLAPIESRFPRAPGR